MPMSVSPRLGCVLHIQFDGTSGQKLQAYPVTSISGSSAPGGLTGTGGARGADVIPGVTNPGLNIICA